MSAHRGLDCGVQRNHIRLGNGVGAVLLLKLQRSLIVKRVCESTLRSIIIAFVDQLCHYGILQIVFISQIRVEGACALPLYFFGISSDSLKILKITTFFLFLNESGYVNGFFGGQFYEDAIL